MIECPYCRAPLHETTPICPGCSLELARARTVMGPAPRLSHRGVTDFAACLSPGAERRIARSIRSFGERFPQSHLAIVFKSFSEDFPLGAHLFWLINTGGLAREDRKWGRNRDILVGIDPTRQHAGLIVGYGLEPFLAQKALDHVMKLAVPKLQGEDYVGGALEIIAGLTRLMAGVCRDLGDTLGLETDFAVEEKAGDY